MPDVVEDAVLGPIRFVHALDGMDEFEAKTKVAKRLVTLTLYTDEEGSLKKCIDRARKIVQRLPVDLDRIKKFIEQRVFPDYNSVWREDLKPLTFQQFLKKVSLQMITTHPDPRATYWFDLGDLMGGHLLQIEIGNRFRILDYSTPG